MEAQFHAFASQMTAEIKQLQLDRVSLNKQLADTQLELNILKNFQKTSIVSTPRVKVNAPNEFSGSREDSRPFIGQCNLVLDIQQHIYNDDSKKIRFFASYLRGNAFLWYQTLLTKEAISTYDQFISDFLSAFGETDLINESNREINRLRQKGSAVSYSTSFNRIAANTKMNDAALQLLFKKGLKEAVKDLLIAYPTDPIDLHDLQKRAVDIDNRQYERKLEQRSIVRPTKETPSSSASPFTNDIGPAPMDVDSTTFRGPLTASEKKRRQIEGLCRYCGQKDCGGSVDTSKCSKLVSRNSGFGQRRSN